MKKSKTTTITKETHEVVVIKHRDKPQIRNWCSECAAEVEMVTPDEAAVIAKVNTRTVYRWIEAGRAHHLETAGGITLVCPNALFGLTAFS